MSAALLAVAAAQLALALLLVLLLAGTRLRRERRERREDAWTAAATEALRAWLLGAPADAFAARLSDMPRATAIETLVLLAGEHVPAPRRGELAGALRGERWVERTVAEAGSRRWWRRLRAARLLEVAATRADAPLVRALLDDAHPAVRVAAVGCLAGAECPALVAHVVDGLAAQPDALRLHVSTLLRRAWQPAAAAAVARLDPDADHRTLAACLQLLVLLGGAVAPAPVLALRAHPAPAVRRGVAAVLATAFHPAVEGALLALLHDAEADVRAEAARALGAQGGLPGGGAAVARLEQALGDVRWTVRLQAGIALARLGAPGRAALRGARTRVDRAARDTALLASGLSEGALADLAAAS